MLRFAGLGFAGHNTHRLGRKCKWLVAELKAAEADAPAVVGAVPRDYNFAADVLKSNLDAGRANKPAYIDVRGVRPTASSPTAWRVFPPRYVAWGSSAKSAC